MVVLCCGVVVVGLGWLGLVVVVYLVVGVVGSGGY